MYDKWNFEMNEEAFSSQITHKSKISETQTCVEPMTFQILVNDLTTELSYGRRMVNEAVWGISDSRMAD